MLDVGVEHELTSSIDFLKTSTEDGTVKEDDKESMEVASQFSFSLRGINGQGIQEPY